MAKERRNKDRRCKKEKEDKKETEKIEWR